MADLSGKFDYSGLVYTLKQEGVKTKDLSSVLRKIADKNNIDNIQEIDKSDEIVISQSIFHTNPFETVNMTEEGMPEEMLLPYDIERNEKLVMPEIFNDDDYEVVDYDDFYGFNNTNEQNDNEKLDFEAFKDKYAKQILDGSKDRNKQNEALENIFNRFDTNSDEYLNSAEISAALNSSAFKQKDIQEGSLNAENDGFQAMDMMEMNMSNDSFNPQG